MKSTRRENEVTHLILGCAFKVHSGLGPGLLESSYEECMNYEMSGTGLWIERQVALPLVYREVTLDAGYRVDFRVENAVILEIKSVEAIHDVHIAQVLTYLKLSGCKIGLLINFNVAKLKEGIKRLIR